MLCFPKKSLSHKCCLFQTFHVNESIECVALMYIFFPCSVKIQSSSLLQHVISTLFLFSPFSGWTFELSLFAVMNNFGINICVQILCGHMFLLLLGMYLEIELPHPIVTLLNGCSNWLYNFTVPQIIFEGSNFLYYFYFIMTGTLRGILLILDQFKKHCHLETITLYQV